MNPKIIYPIPIRQSQIYRNLRNFCRILFIVAALVCLLINFLVKGKAWSLIVVWSLFITWRAVFSLKLSEFSVFSHIISLSIYVIILLVLIDRFLISGWAQTVVPIVFFAIILIMMIVYYATYEKKERHIVSISFLAFISIISIPYYYHSWPIENWVGFAFHLASLVLSLILAIISRKEIMRELKVRFKRKDD